MCPVTLSALGLGSLAATAGGTGAAALTTTQIVSLGLTVASGAFGLVQSLSQASAQKKALKQQARAEDDAAKDALARGTEESNRKRLIGARERSEQAARMAANGVSITSGDALDVLDEAALITEEDAFSIRTNAGRESQGLNQQAANSRTQAAAAGRQGIFDGVGTVLTTGSRVASQWRSFTSAPVT